MVRTCLCTIHQPSPQIFELFDKIVLLSAGKLVYFGPAQKVVPYFSQESVGYLYDGLENPAEFILNIASGKVKPESATNARSAEELEAIYNNSVLRESCIPKGNISIILVISFALHTYIYTYTHI